MVSIVSRIVEVCVFRFAGNSPEYLLLKRSPGDMIHPGIWQIITGMIGEGETAVRAARREAREETGVEPDRFWVVPFTGSFYDPRTDEMHLIAFFAAQIGADAAVRFSSEHAAYEWLGLAEARRRLVWPGQREGLDIVDRCIAGGEEAARLSLLPPDAVS